jgi:hypothetical protein
LDALDRHWRSVLRTGCLVYDQHAFKARILDEGQVFAMFEIDSDAAGYLWLRGALAVIDLKLEYSVGDALGSGKRLIGCQVPKIRVGPDRKPPDPAFLTERVNGVTVHYHPQLRVKTGYRKIRFVLRRLLCWQWLELEGAKATPVFDE